MARVTSSAQPPQRVLVTGVSRYLGGRLATLLQADPSIEQVIGVDTVAPTADLGRTEFVRADIRNPLIAKVISSAEIDTVVHMNVIATPLSAGGRAAMKETNVIGTMQLLAACQKAPHVRKLIVKSTTAVYGSSPRDPALFTEDVEPRAVPRGGYTKDAVEVEGYVRGFGRRRPDVSLTLLRFTNFIGPRIDSLLTRYFALPVVPTVLGFDPRIQLCHEDDGIAVLREATMAERPGIYNVGGSGVLLLSQAVRRAGRPSFAVPSPSVAVVGQVFRRAGLVDFSPEQMRYLSHGRVVDTSRLRADFDAAPTWTTAEAFEDYVTGSVLRRGVSPAALRAWSGVLGRGLSAVPGLGRLSELVPESPGPERSDVSAKVIPINGREPDFTAAAATSQQETPAASGTPGTPPIARTVAGWEQSLADGLAFLRRRVTGDYQVDDFGFDPDVNDNVFMAPLRPLYEKWFRVETRGLENVPDTTGALVVANHSGTIPVDALMTQLALLDHHPAHRHLRMLAADLVFQLPGIAPLARKAGHTLACQPDAERLLRSDELVGVFPEGFKGIGKPFSERYKLQRFGRGGFVSAALRTGKPIIPVSIVGAEEIYPILGNLKLAARLLGLPYVPVTPTFPLLGPLGLVPLPSKWFIAFGDPIETAHYGEAAADDPMLVFNLTDQVRETIQQTLYSLLVERRGVFF